MGGKNSRIFRNVEFDLDLAESPIVGIPNMLLIEGHAGYKVFLYGLTGHGIS